jgi:hypothetical protein
MADPLLPPPPLPEVPVYRSNMVGPGYNPRYNEFQRLQDLEWDYHRSRVEEGTKLIKTRRPPDFSYQLGNIGLAEQETGLKFRPRPSAAEEILESLRSRPDPEPLVPKYHVPKPHLSLGRTLPVEDIVGPVISKYCRAPDISLAPLLPSSSPKESVFLGMGHSHFSFVHEPKKRKFHVTTQIPGLGEKEGFDKGFSVHTSIKIGKKGGLIFEDED